MASSDIAPKSVKRTFPCIRNSQAMRQFSDVVLANAKRDHFAVTPILLDANAKEFPSFVYDLCKGLHILGHVAFIHEGLPRMPAGDEEGLDVIVFTDGGKIPPSFQRDFAARLFPNIRLMLAVVEQDSQAYHDGIAGGEIKYPWITSFRELAPRTYTWPCWRDRHGDHVLLIEQMHCGLSMPKGFPVPKLSEDAMKWFLAQPFNGTDDVERTLKKGLERYIMTSDRSSILSPRHFITPPDAPVSSGRRSRRQIQIPD